MDKDKIAIVLISAAIIVAGCTNGENDDEVGGEGLVITQFEAFPGDPFTDESTNMEMELLNRGDADADILAARIGGHVIDNDDDDETAWSLDGDDQNQLSLGTARAGDEEFEPLPEEIVWRMRSPERISQSTSPYTWTGSVYYSYETEASSSIDLVTSRDEQGNVPSADSSSAPVNMNINTRSPILVDEDTDEVRVRVEATNVAHGEVFSPDTQFDTEEHGSGTSLTKYHDGREDDDYEGEGKVNITLEDPPGNIEVEENNEVEIDMSRGSGRHTFTLIGVDDAVGAGTDTLTVELSLSADYVYMTERDVGVTVGER